MAKVAGASTETIRRERSFAKVSEAWRDKMGVGMSLTWPTGAGVKGSFGAATTVPVTLGSIGYAEFSYVAVDHLTTVQIRNKADTYVAPDGDAFAAAVANADWTHAENFAVDLTDAPGERSWPIVTPTFVLVPKNPDKAATSATTIRFFSWAFDHGDDAARSLQYVPLPATVKTEIMKTWNK